jgi:hypothetical protein
MYIDPKEPLLKHIRSMRPDLEIDRSMSVSRLADLVCDISGDHTSASQEEPRGTAELSRSDVGDAATRSWVEKRAKQIFETEREQERELWRQVFGQVLADQEKKIGDFERKLDDVERRSSLDAQFRELEIRLDARQLARDEAKRGLPGRAGERGARGPQGERGARGQPGRDAAKIAGWEVDAENYLAHPIMSDGTRGGALDLKPLLQQFLTDTKL